MIVCIAEKPSVGRDIARVLGANQVHDGYMEGNGYQVTWTFGHLCSLLDPQEYSDQWKRWTLSSLPMIPDRFSIKVTNDKGVQKQFNTIRSLMLSADMIINCGDAGQEGELIQRWVMQKIGVSCPVKRLWISSLTEEAIREGFQHLKAQEEYDSLYKAGLMRSIGDWLLGMNATRAYTLRYQTAAPRGSRQEPLSIGRVQTPTLALIVARQKEIDNFVPRTYWELKTNYKNTTFSAITRKSEEDLLGEIQKLQEAKEKKGEKGKDILIPTLAQLQQSNIGIDPIPSAEAGEALIQQFKQLPFMVTKVEKKKGIEYAPRLFDLTSLQVECNKKYGYSADKTLTLIQSLYEKHVTTYPRVDTTYLSDDIYPKVPNIFRGIESYFPPIGRLRELLSEEQRRTGKAAKLPKSKKVFDNSKVTDHHAIIPTGQAPQALTEDERKVYDLIALRFIAAFYPDCQICTTTIYGEVSDDQNRLQKGGNAIPFKTSGKQILVKGWREVFESTKAEVASEDENEEEKTRLLPDFTEYEMGPHTPTLSEKQTTPPKPFTEATLLRAMETAGRLVEDDELRDALKENGIGRPSTRAAIIEKLFQRKYIIRKGKSIAPTTVGVELIRTIHTPLLKSAELTGQWEKKLKMIERSEMDAGDFLSELKQLTQEVVKEVKTSKIGYLCPVCRQGVIIRGNSSYGCSRWREGCNYREPLHQQHLEL